MGRDKNFSFKHLLPISISVIWLLSSFQNCAPNPFGQEFESVSHNPLGGGGNSSPSYNSSFWSPAQSLKDKGYQPGPQSQSQLACKLEQEQQSYLAPQGLENRLILSGNTLEARTFSLVAAIDNHLVQRHMVTLNNQGRFLFPEISFSDQVQYYLEIQNASGQVLCKTSQARISKLNPDCRLYVDKSSVSYGSSAQLWLRHNLGPTQQFKISWIREYNNQIIENGTQSEPFMQSTWSWIASQGPGSYRLQAIVRYQDQEICRSSWIRLKALTQEESETPWIDVKNPSRGQSSSPNSSGSGSGSAPALDQRSEEERNYCKATSTQVQCWVQRTYCQGQAPYQIEKTDDSPVLRTLGINLPRAQRATVLKNTIEFQDKRYSIISLKSLFFCNPDTNPQWQYLSEAGFLCHLRIDERPAKGCDGSGLNSP